MSDLVKKMEEMVRKDLKMESPEQRGQFKAITTKKPDGYSFNEVEVFGDLIHSDDKVYIHPVCNSVTVANGIGKLIIMHEVQPDTVEQLY